MDTIPATKGSPGSVAQPVMDVPADLAAVAAEVAGTFPLVLAQTSLVLLDVDPGHLHAFWTLAPGDLAQARAAFPAGGGEPQPVVSLRRLHDSGEAEVVTSIPLAGAARGDARFALVNDGATYQAEVGLRNAGGGWVLVARSNQARLPRPVGIDIPAWDGVEPEAPAQIESPAESQVAPSGQVAAVPEPSPNTASGLGLDPAALPPAGTRPARWVVAVAAAGLPAEVAGSATVPTDEAWVDWAPVIGPQGLADQAAPPPGLGRSIDPAPAPLWPTDASSESESVSWAQAPDLANPAPSQADDLIQSGPQPPGPISSFALGEGPEAPVIDAEVLVRVRARPGTLVDLFGHPLRVGPSGETTLRAPVTDLALVAPLLGG
jgi:hypothetical protein